MDISILVGMTLAGIEGGIGDDEIVFTTDKGRKFRLFHYQDCCESVTVEDICGELSALIGYPILIAREDTSDENPADITLPEHQDSFTWTFYNLSTVKGSVTIRWYGESNGYYSEGVAFEEMESRELVEALEWVLEDAASEDDRGPAEALLDGPNGAQRAIRHAKEILAKAKEG